MKKSLRNLLIGVASLSMLTACSNMSEVDYATFHENALAVEDPEYMTASVTGSYVITTDGSSTTYDLASEWRTITVLTVSMFSSTSGSTTATLLVGSYINTHADDIDEDDEYTYYYGKGGFKVTTSETESETDSEDSSFITSTEKETYIFDVDGYLTSYESSSTVVTTIGSSTSTTTSEIEFSVEYGY